jgi:hypothetical protein
MNPTSKQFIRIFIRVALFCTPIMCLVCGIIIEREAFVIGGAMGILLAFIISILTEFHERQIQRRQSIRILVSGSAQSMRNITIEIVPSSSMSAVVFDEIPSDRSCGNNTNNNYICDKNTGAPKDEGVSKISAAYENI